jgi:heme o synthase
MKTIVHVAHARRHATDVRAIGWSYFRLTKPRIVLLLLITTVPSMMLAARGLPSVWLMAATLLGGTALAGGANAINQYLERDIDRVMARTRDRPLPARLIEPKRALTFGLVLGALGFAWLTVTVNVLAALLALSAFAFYVLVYTAWLKPTSPQNIVIGGAAGAVPVLVGWAAVTGRVALPAVVLFAVIFLWTPPHFWALALRYERDYSAAGIPMLPVVAGKDETTKQILRYSVLLVAATLALHPIARMGAIYGAAAVVLGILFVARALQLRAGGSILAAVRLFRFSILYLALLFGAVALDVLIPVRWPGA